MSNPLVSIIVPCYNQAQYLDEALDSVLKQSFENWECIIVDDGSPDNTEEVVEKWLEKDSRFKYVFQENGGLSSARNYGISKSEGEFILPLDADDKISTDYTKLAIEAFEKDSCLILVYCKAEKFGGETGSWDLPDFSLFNLARLNMIFCSAFYKKVDWELLGGYDQNMICGLEDWEFWIALLKNGGGVKCIEDVGFYYRVKSVSMVKNINTEKRKEVFEYLSIKHSDFFVKQLGSTIILSKMLEQNKKKIGINLKSKKFVIDLFCKTFFGFEFFGRYKKLIKEQL
jgi:glycosyltransferase involved in cell wall biosynthesis